MGKVYFVGKSKYYELLGTDTKEYNVVRWSDIMRTVFSGEDSPTWDVALLSGWRYYFALENGSVFVADSRNGVLLIHKKYNISNIVQEIESADAEISIDHWEITKLNNDIPYCINEYTRGGAVKLVKSGETDDDIIYTSGEYLIKDTRWGEEHRIHIYHCVDGFGWIEDYMMYPGKNDLPLRGSAEALMFREFISRIFYEKATGRKRRDNGGQ